MNERVVIVEDHAMMLDGLVALLSNDTRLEIVGTAATLAELRDGLADWDPTIIVADYQLPDGTGAEIPAFAASVEMAVPVLLMSGIATTRVLDEAIASGCAGYVSKALRGAALTDAIVNVGRGASVFPPEALANTRAKGPSPKDKLTARECEVLEQLATGKNATEISELLDLSLNTVRNHIRSILSKLHARSQLEAVLMAARSGAIQLDLD